MSTTTHQGAETMTAGPGDLLYRSEWETTRTITHEEAHEIARRLIASHFRRTDCETARASIPANPDRDDDLLINSYIKQQARKEATPAPRTGGGMTAGEDHAWTFERTRAYLLAELERLRADLHTIGEDLTGEQGKAASWLDVATGRVANVSSVLASATPAQPAGAVPESLRALSEAFRYVDQQDWDFLYERLGDGGRGRFWKAVFGEVRPLLATHPAGQSAGSGADGWLPIETAPKDGTRVDLWVVPHDAFANGNADRLEARWMERVGWVRIGGGYVSECGEPTHWRQRPGAPDEPAPDSTRTGQGEADRETIAREVFTAWFLAQTAIHDGIDVEAAAAWKAGTDYPDEFDLAYAAADRVIAARPAAPEAQGAWRPISTAPNPDDSYADLPGYAREGVGFAKHEDTEEMLYLVWWKYRGGGVSEATHWAPIPAPPASSGQEG